jgi:hypothetical protein
MRVDQCVVERVPDLAKNVMSARQCSMPGSTVSLRKCRGFVCISLVRPHRAYPLSVFSLLVPLHRRMWPDPKLGANMHSLLRLDLHPYD